MEGRKPIVAKQQKSCVQGGSWGRRSDQDSTRKFRYLYQGAETSGHTKLGLNIWDTSGLSGPVRSVWFVWFHETHMDQTDQIHKTGW